MTHLVVFSVLICSMVNGQVGDECDTIEIRAQSCEQAARWLAGWMPPLTVAVSVDCVEQRVAAR